MTDVDPVFVFTELVRYETELWNAIDARLRRDCDLALAEFEFLRVISRRRSCRVQDIAEDLAITVGGTSKIVDRLEAAGHCARAVNPADKRSSLITLTRSGKGAFLRASEVFDAELHRRLRAPVSGRALQQLSRTLVALRAAGREIDAPVHSPS